MYIPYTTCSSAAILRSKISLKRYHIYIYIILYIFLRQRGDFALQNVLQLSILLARRILQYIYIYIYILICICIHIYICRNTNIYVYIFIFTCGSAAILRSKISRRRDDVHIGKHINKCINMYIYIYTYINIYINAYMYICRG